MSRLRILFMPSFFGTPSHFIPLVKLYQRLDHAVFESAFFLNRMRHEELGSEDAQRIMPNARYYYGGEFYSHFDIPVLEQERKYTLVSEIAAYRMFRPDLIVDDTSILTAFARRVVRIPRMTLLRGGTFSDSPARMRGYRSSIDRMIEPHVSRAGGEGLQKLEDYFEAEAYLVPGIAAIERPGGPAAVRARTRHVGPLMLDEREEAMFQSQELLAFLGRHAGRRVAYVNFGVVAVRQVNQVFMECFRSLLRRDYVVVSNVRLHGRADEALAALSRDRYFQADVLPMHHVCSRAELIVDVSSSASCHYPILHGKPAITVGTRSADREDTAMALDSSGLSRHLGSPDEVEDFAGKFEHALDDVLLQRFPFDPGLARRLEFHRQEIRRAQESFDFNQVAAEVIGGVFGPAREPLGVRASSAAE